VRNWPAAIHRYQLMPLRKAAGGVAFALCADRAAGGAGQ